MKFHSFVLSVFFSSTVANATVLFPEYTERFTNDSVSDCAIFGSENDRDPKISICRELKYIVRDRRLLVVSLCTVSARDVLRYPGNDDRLANVLNIEIGSLKRSIPMLRTCSGYGIQCFVTSSPFECGYREIEEFSAVFQNQIFATSNDNYGKRFVATLPIRTE